MQFGKFRPVRIEFGLRWWSESESCSVVSDSLRPHGLCAWSSPGQNTGAGSLSLHQGIFPTQGSNPGLPHCRWILYQLSHQGSPRILEWVAVPFSRGSSWPRNWTGVSCTAGRFFTSWATREAPEFAFWQINKALKSISYCVWHVSPPHQNKRKISYLGITDSE